MIQTFAISFNMFCENSALSLPRLMSRRRRKRCPSGVYKAFGLQPLNHLDAPRLSGGLTCLRHHRINTIHRSVVRLASM